MVYSVLLKYCSSGLCKGTSRQLLLHIECATEDTSQEFAQSLESLLTQSSIRYPGKTRLLTILNKGLRTLNMQFIDSVAHLLLSSLEVLATDESSEEASRFAKALRGKLQHWSALFGKISGTKTLFRDVYHRLQAQGYSFPPYTEEFAHRELCRLVRLRGYLFEGQLKAAGTLYAKVSADKERLQTVLETEGASEYLEYLLQVANSTLSLCETEVFRHFDSQHKLAPIIQCEASMAGTDSELCSNSDISFDFDLDQDCEELKQAYCDLKDTLQSKEAEVTELLEENLVFQENNARLTSSLKQQQNKAQAWKAKYEQAQKAQATVEAELRTLQQAHSNLQTKHAQLLAQVNELHTQTQENRSPLCKPLHSKLFVNTHLTDKVVPCSTARSRVLLPCNLAWLPRALLTSPAILYEDASIQVGVKVERRPEFGLLHLYFGNKTGETIHSFRVVLDSTVPGIQMKLDSQREGCSIYPGKSVPLSAAVKVTKSFRGFPHFRVSYDDTRLLLALPVLHLLTYSPGVFEGTTDTSLSLAVKPEFISPKWQETLNFYQLFQCTGENKLECRQACFVLDERNALLHIYTNSQAESAIVGELITQVLGNKQLP